MSKWTIKNHGKVVNLYQIMKMLDGETIEATERMMKESYIVDVQADYPIRSYKGMTFDEYVNAKRHFIATILDKVEFA